MPRIELQVEVRASPERCFDLARDLDLHARSMAASQERAVRGRTTGMIEFGETVTWRARHFGVFHEHTSRITAFNRPRHFRDSMVDGRFASFEHDHYFEPVAGGTLMRDVLEFRSPFGPLGRLVDEFVLSRYLERVLAMRNQQIKLEAERAG